VYPYGVLSPGTRFDTYVVVAGVGAGGMGEVYRATDTSLGRDVALKILPAPFNADPERVARFRREARLLASLNHPNIAQIHGTVQAEGAHAIVLEFVDGESLANRIARGAMPLDEALAVARQIAEALEAAHEAGIIHRDLKPANVMLTREGRVKVLDFGLGKLMEGTTAASEGDETATLTSPAMTTVGTLMGTAAYMAPEQARGLQADRRADVWAFGCILFEMLTGRRAFAGNSVTDTLAAIVRGEPDWARVSTAPEPIRALLRRSLQKPVGSRLQCMGDARVAIDELGSATAETAPSGAARQALPWLVAAGALAAAALVTVAAWTGAWGRGEPARAEPASVTRFTIALPAGHHLASTNKPALAVSEDGSQLAFVAAGETTAQQIYLRAMDRTDAVALPGTEGAVAPFFSPDGAWLGFFANGKLQKISVKGGTARVLADVANPQGASWNGHTIVFASDLSVLLQIPDEGGTPQAMTRFDSGEIAHAFPRFLPDGRNVLFTALTASTPPAIVEQRLDASDRRKLASGQDGSMPAYLASGHLIFAQDNRLMATTLDAGGLASGSTAVPIVEDVYAGGGVAQFAVSPSGTLAYVAAGGRASAFGLQLVWVNRDGSESPLAAPVRNYNQPRLSPDGRRIAIDIIPFPNPEQVQVWLYDIGGDALSRFTFTGGNRHPVWTHDGSRIAFMSDREGPQQVFWKRADGSGAEERLTQNTATQTGNVYDIPYTFSPDGKVLTVARVGPTTGADVWAVPVDRTASADSDPARGQRLLHSTAADAAPQLSPDGLWLAYASDESGRREIYVQAYPGPGGKWQVSDDGGNEPMWNPNGRELFYRNGDRMMSVEVNSAHGFTFGKPRVLFTGRYRPSSNWWARPNYDVSADGQRFLMLKTAGENSPPPTEVNVVLNWTAELRRLVATAR
jgi:serine/threonine-protein kinase